MKIKFLLVCVLAILLVGCGSESVDSGAGDKAESPTAPIMNSAVCADDGSVDVVWKKDSYADEYYIYRSATADGIYEKIATVGEENGVYKDTDVKSCQ